MEFHDATGRAGSFDVQSTDGTTIRVWVQGDGPPIVLVHGSLRDHTIFDPLVAHLEPARRRMRSTVDYSIEQEFEDVAAVVDAIAARAAPVALDVSCADAIHAARRCGDPRGTHVLGGHGHLACITDPDLTASIITQFVGIGAARA